ncbi:FLU1-II [Coprinopsis sp. MPI-PUGE-AT-0042]|nr:FLU1-II [Coprinopsis sp. MPI-PUGE-AT-0042]
MPMRLLFCNIVASFIYNGVLYEPSQRSPILVADELEQRGIAYVRVQWLDLTNLVRFRKHLQAQRPGINVACVALGLVVLSIAEGFGSAGEYVYVFDMSSLKLCPYAPRHASVMGFFQEKASSPGRELTVPPLSHRLNSLVGYETEFILLGSKEEAKNNHAYSVSSALYTGSVETTVMEEIADALPYRWHRHGLRATLVPRLHQDSAGSGSHLHFSVQFHCPITGRHPGIIPCCPNRASSILGFHQLPNHGFLWQDGRRNLVRRNLCVLGVRITRNSFAHRNFELKTIDGTANPYLVLAGMLGVGGIGLKSGQQLSQKPIEVSRSAVEMSAEERDAHGINQRLPLNIAEAREKFHLNTVLRQVLGEEFVASYLNVNDALNRNLDAQEGLLVKMY